MDKNMVFLIVLFLFVFLPALVELENWWKRRKEKKKK